MGKPKAKGLKVASNESSQDLALDKPNAGNPENSLRAADGHNVDGWTDEDIRTYNELLTERAKLEKEKNELEQKSSRHQTQRALLDENATALDSFFKAQSGGDFKFTGTGRCCLDFNAACQQGTGKGAFPCKHEICTRSKSKGVSWMEMDTIKYYHARISSEKSQRMQSALRKQRDVELVRVRKDDEEEAALRARRNAILDKATRSSQGPLQTSKTEKVATAETSALDMLPTASKDFLLDPKNSAILDAAKENEHIVRRIRGRLDKIRHDVNAGRVSPADARVKLDQANSEMAEAERKNNDFRQMILDAEPALSQLHQPNFQVSRQNSAAPTSLTTVLQNTLASTNADAFSQALTVMKGFFSASDPHDVQTAITDLRGVLELNGPMSPVLQKSFKALEDMLAKPNARGFTIDVTTDDGKTKTCSNVIEVMMNLRLRMQGSKNTTSAGPDLNLDENTVKSNLECMKVEDAAKKDMLKVAEKMVEDTTENVGAALKKIKAKAILKSPIPPLSDLVLDDVITDVLFRRSIKTLTVEAVAGSTANHLSGKLTSLIIATARNKPEKYLAILMSAKDCIEKSRTTPPSVLLEALAKVDDSMSKFVAAHQEKIKKSSAAAKPITPSSVPPIAPIPSSSKPPLVDTRNLLEGSLVDEVEWQQFVNFLNTPSANDARKLRARIYEYYHRNLEEGIWELLRAVLDHQSENKFFWTDYDQEKSFCVDNMQLAAAEPEPKLIDTVSRLQELGICPGRAAILVAQRITMQIRDNFEVARDQAIALKTVFAIQESNKSNDWLHSFNFIAQTMTDMFSLLVYSLYGEEDIDVPIMAADLLAFTCTFVLGSMTASKAEANLRFIESFLIDVLLDLDIHNETYRKLQTIILRFRLACQDSECFRCPPEHTCQTKFREFAVEKLDQLVPAPLRLNKKDGLRPEDDPASPLFQTSSGLSRDTHLQYLVESYWGVAKALTPHLKCLVIQKKCGCNKLDKEFAQEIQTLKNSIDAAFVQVSVLTMENKPVPKPLWDTLERSAVLLHERPRTWPGNQKRVDELRSKVGKSRFEEHFPPEHERPGPPPSLPVAKTPTNTSSHMSLKQVPVNVPSIQESVSSSNFEKAKLEKETVAALSSKKTEMPERTEEQAEGLTKSMVVPLEQSDIEEDDDEDEECDPWPMTEREVELRNQLLEFTDSVDTMHSFAKESQAGINQYALDGVAWQIEDMLIGHVEMAYLIAKAQDYQGLKAWIQYYFSNTMPTPLDDNFKVNGGGNYSAISSLDSMAAPQKKKALETAAYLQKLKQQVKTQTPAIKQKSAAAPSSATAASTAAAVQEAEKAVANVEQLGRNFIEQMQIVSGRKKRIPKRLR